MKKDLEKPLLFTEYSLGFVDLYISTPIDAGVNINTIREMVGHEDERATFNSYCFDRTDKTDRMNLIEKALA